MELPTNKLITILLALIVLVAVIMLFSGTVGGIGDDLNAESAIRNCCNKFRASGCSDLNICCELDYLGEGTEPICLKQMYELRDAADMTDEQIKKICSC